MASGGQILVSRTTRDLIQRDLPAGASLRDLGRHRLKDLDHAEHLYQVLAQALPSEFPPVRSLDTLNNLHRALGRKPLGEFEMRVLFQMSANDSATLIDSPKASNLGLHRALLYNEQHGAMETFRPYALPPQEWLEEAAAKLNAPRMSG